MTWRISKYFIFVFFLGSTDLISQPTAVDMGVSADDLAEIAISFLPESVTRHPSCVQAIRHLRVLALTKIQGHGERYDQFADELTKRVTAYTALRDEAEFRLRQHFDVIYTPPTLDGQGLERTEQAEQALQSARSSAVLRLMAELDSRSRLAFVMSPEVLVRQSLREFEGAQSQAFQMDHVLIRNVIPQSFSGSVEHLFSNSFLANSQNRLALSQILSQSSISSIDASLPARVKGWTEAEWKSHPYAPMVKEYLKYTLLILITEASLLNLQTERGGVIHAQYDFSSFVGEGISLSLEIENERVERISFSR